MENEFDNVMRKRTDADLIKILDSSPDDYQPAALDAAKREFDRRNLSQEQVTIVHQEIEQEQLVDEERSNAPLSIFPKVFAFIFPGLLLIIFAGTYKADGYDRKAKELVKWTLYGFGFYISIPILILILSRIF